LFANVTVNNSTTEPVAKLKHYLTMLLPLIFLLFAVIVSYTLWIKPELYTVKNLRVSNLSGKSATLTWETDTPSITQVRIKKDSALTFSDRQSSTLIYDDRDTAANKQLRRTHYVTLNGLDPSSLYFFSIGSRLLPATSSFNNFTTYAISERIDTPQPIYGAITLASGQQDFSDLVVYYFVHDPASNTDSSLYAAVPSSEGKWSGEVTSIRAKTGAMFFSEDQVLAMASGTVIASGPSEPLPDNVLGLNDANGQISTESFTGADSTEASEYLQVSVSNANVTDTTFVPFASLSEGEVVSNYLDDVTNYSSSILGVSTYSPDNANIALTSASAGNTNTGSNNLQTLSAYCGTYGNHTLNSCTNTACPSGRNCAANSLSGANATLCLSRNASYDSIYDCCPSGSSIVNGVCVAPGYCGSYGNNTLNMCTNTACPSGRNCAPNSLTSADVTKCLARGGGYDVIADCCAAGVSISGTRCAVAGYCSSYGNNPLNSCTNTACPTGRSCAGTSLGGANVTKCLARSSYDVIADCCAAGSSIINGQCVAPGYCGNYGNNPLNMCTNTACPSGRSCAGNSLGNANVTKCLARGGGYDVIADCCASGSNIVNGQCVAPGQCNSYGTFPLNSCTNSACPTGRNCSGSSLGGANPAKCVNRGGNNDTIVDCCPATYTISNGQCVAPGQCNSYGTFPLNSCTNSTCPSGRACAGNALTNAAVTKCVNRGANNDTIGDCCAAGATIQNGSCIGGTTPTPTVLPSGNICQYGAHPLNSCNNTACPSGRNCAPNTLTGADPNATKCLARSSQDYIADCCVVGYQIVNNICVPISGTPTPGISISVEPTPTPTPTAPPMPLNGCVTLQGATAQAQALGQQILNTQIIPMIAQGSGLPAFPITLLLTGDGAECNSYTFGTIVCSKPGNGAIWLTNKLLFHEAMHQFKAKYYTGSATDTGTSELMASILEGYYVRETCMGGEYSFYGLGDSQRQYPRKPDEIRNNSGLSTSQLWQYAILGKTSEFTEPVVDKVIPGAWKYIHLYCNGFKQWVSQYDPPGCQGDQLGNVSTTFNVALGIDLVPKNINDFDNGQYRLDLKYKTLTSSHSIADVTVPVRLTKQSGCAAGDTQCVINNVTLPAVYVDKKNPTDPTYALNVSLNSDIKNDLNCWTTSQPIPDGDSSLQLNLQDMTCDYSFGNNPIGGTCSVADLGTSGLTAPWSEATHALQSQPFTSSHPGIDVQADDGSTLVAAADGVVAYTRTGDVKDSIYFDSVRWGTKCEEGSRLDPNNWVCLCDWCPLDKVKAQAPNRPDVCNSQRDCVARAEALENASPDWAVDGAIHRIYGNVVIIQHANHQTIYGHMQSVAVNVGDCVTAGQVIGVMGTTGSSSGTHVHFEIRANKGGILNPSSFHCNGTGCNYMAFAPGQGANSYQNFLGVSTDESPDSTDGALQFTDPNASALGQGVYKLSSPVVASKNVVVKDAASTPKFYIDTNKNNKLDPEELVLGANIVNAQFSQVASLQDVALGPTWNLASFNAINDTTLTTKDIAQQADLSGIKLEIASYDTDKWVISALKQEGNVNSFYGNEYNLIPGKAFFVKTDNTSVYYNTGTIRTNINKELNLDLGWNFFSFSQDVLDADPISSFTFLQKCQAANIGCTLFSDYNGELDNTVMVKDTLYGKDYPLVANKGYIVKVDANPGKISF